MIYYKKMEFAYCKLLVMQYNRMQGQVTMVAPSAHAIRVITYSVNQNKKQQRLKRKHDGEEEQEMLPSHNHRQHEHLLLLRIHSSLAQYKSTKELN